MSAIYNQRVLERSLRAPDVRHRGGRHVNHLQELHSAADAVAEKRKKATGAGSDSRGMTSEQMVEYRLRGASEEEGTRLALVRLYPETARGDGIALSLLHHVLDAQPRRASGFCSDSGFARRLQRIR